MAANGAPRPEPQHPPIARDAQGNLIAIPEGTAAWRICRQTTGRPKEIVGPDKRMVRFPLETTIEELAEMCGNDVFRVYALDEVGKLLDYVVTVDLARGTSEPRNAAPPDGTLVTTLRPMAVPSSDLRFALEAMAQMMRVNSEAMRAIAESQADWVKSIASTRGFFRNAPAPYPSPEPPRDDDDEAEVDEDDQPPHGKSIYDVLAPIAENLAPSVKPIVSMLTSKAGNASRASAALASGDSNATLETKPGWEVRDLLDLNYAAAKGRAKRAGKHPTATLLQERVMSDPKLLSQFLAVKALLQPDELTRLFALGERMTAQEQESLLAEISAVSPDDAAQLLRALLVELDASITTDRTT